ncbi:MAG: hypothetical protein ACE10H_02020 [Candidatus Binatia bacterium]
MTTQLRKRGYTEQESLPVTEGENRQTKSSGARKKRFSWAGGLLFIVGLVAYGLFVTDLLGGSRAAGEPAPDVTLNTANGEFRLSQQRGKVLLLYFSFPG